MPSLSLPPSLPPSLSFHFQLYMSLSLYLSLAFPIHSSNYCVASNGQEKQIYVQS